MTAIHGTIGPFNINEEDWTSYVERVEEYFVGNDVDDNTKKRAILLSNCGAQTYQLLKKLVAPGKPSAKTYAELVQLLTEHWQPKPSQIIQRYHFHTRKQRDNESVSEFVAELRKLSEYCEFADLDMMLRDRLVCGVRDVRIQKKLLAEPKLTYKQAFDTVQAMEVAEKNVQDLQLNPVTKPVYRMQEFAQLNQRPFRTITESASACYRCGGTKHKSAECRFREVICRQCGKKGHIARVCRSRPTAMPHSKPTMQPTTQRTKQSAQKKLMHLVTAEVTDEEPKEYSLFNLGSDKAKATYRVIPNINGVDVEMEIDTGASVSLISETTFKELWTGKETPVLRPTKVNLSTYTGEKIGVCGKINVNVKINGQAKMLTLLVVKGNGPSLLGMDWLQRLKLDWTRVHRVTSQTKLQEVLTKYSDVFTDELGKVQGLSAKLHLKSEAQPRFYKVRPVALALKKRVEKELERLQEAGVIESVSQSEWATPIVPVVKPNGSIRICGDFKVTLNKAIRVDSYPLPRIDDLLGSLAGGQTFSKLDLAHAYMQIPLEESSKQLTTINTHKGLYRYNRLPFGIASAPAVFQRTMETLLQGIPQVCVYIDDILITGKTVEEHLVNLEEVLRRLEKANMRLKQEKCSFLLPKVEYLGHIISDKGILPSKRNIEAIDSAPAPANVSQLKSFLGMVTYYLKFVPNLSNTLAPLYRLLQKNYQWRWEKSQEEAFSQVKKQLISPPILAAYDPDKNLILSCDASPYGIGAVLAHKEKDGTERPIAYSSRSLATAEKGYSQLDKEALALVFGVKKFHNYLYGRHFTLMSDHKPLKHILGETSPVPQMASARLQRWALLLGAYSYSIQYKSGKENVTADALSRIPLSQSPPEVPIPGETVQLIETLDPTPINFKQIARWTELDPLLSRIRHLILNGWVDTKDSSFAPYQNRRNELSVHNGCILWGSRVIVPSPGQKKTLELLHEGHLGISRMKAKARSYVWWPKIDQDIEQTVKGCYECQRIRHSEAAVPYSTWEFPREPWRRLHIDYVGPFQGKMFLLLVDAYSKWLEVSIVNSANSTTTIEKLRKIFATHGLPTTVISDNGSVFTSEEFETFLQRNGIRHVKTAPYHPASNGQVERTVQIFKEAIKKSKNGSLETQVSRFLFQYRTTVHSTTGHTPAELLMGRRLRTLFDCMHPDLALEVERKRQDHNSQQKGKHFVVLEAVYVQDLPSREWISGKISGKRGNKLYLVELSNGRVIRRHVDNIRRREEQNIQVQEDELEDLDVTVSRGDDSELDDVIVEPEEGLNNEMLLRRSIRVRQPPNRYSPSRDHS